MKLHVRRCFALVWPMLALLILSGLTPAADINLAVPKDVLSDYQKLVGNRNVQEITDYSGDGARRDTVEVILFQQALHLGGMKDPIRFVPIDNYMRNITEVELGRVTAMGTSAWAADLKDSKASLSLPTLREGEYVVGFYTTEHNQKVQHATLEQLRQLTVITNKAWHNDISTLEKLGINKIESAPTFAQMVKMLNAGRGDFIMTSFKPNPDLSFEIEGIKLLPVRDLKVAMPGSRHFLVSNNEQGQQVLAALNQGLNQLRKEGRIRRAYTDGGFFTKKIENWTLLNQNK
ncbi:MULTISPECIES: hypothetical protein [Deefgea]|uniref:Transporter substrate-binding domain-containing protein n=1 Tax=Deefgea chitinilytica TaxID=570276 RepID=A0ABS2CEP3_9NEIS|nr:MULTISPECIES: hypothetical protein [Deefgea]MBM5572482.1 hypothetical protein [Deefgea chitinilytica]MBM9889718.1 hypothetical protein [Deefgea sp. CFH1-16]